jgi:hypothetical protein
LARRALQPIKPDIGLVLVELEATFPGRPHNGDFGYDQADR